MQTNKSAFHNYNFIYILIIILVILVTFFNALSAGFLIIDDTNVLRLLKSPFLPTVAALFHSAGAIYYRPLPMASFMLDLAIFGTNPAGFHLINVLLHLANALLVYFLTLEFLRQSSKKETHAFVAALIFALHPINTEAVLWISARPDLLSCFFFLISLILIIRYAHSPTHLLPALLFLSFLCALLSKESSLALLALTPLCLILDRKNLPTGRILTVLIPILMATAVYVYLRNGFTPGVDKGVTKIVANGKSTSTLIVNALAAYGFYVRKLFFPFPLNFVITTIGNLSNMLTLFLFITAGSILMILHKSFRLPVLLILTGIIPPLLALTGNLPFVAYAERYLYIPLIGFSLFIVVFLSHYITKVPPLAVISIVLLTALPTIQRVNLWGDPVMFWRDAVTKSPGCAVARLALAAELINAGHYTEAGQHIRNASEIGMTREGDKSFAAEITNTLDRLTKNEAKIALP